MVKAQTQDDAPDKAGTDAAATTQSAGKVLYKGMSHVRQITKEEWKAVGIDDGETIVWNAGNLYMVPLDKLNFLNEEQFNAYIKADADFAIIDGDKDSLPRSHPHNNRYNPPEAYTEGLPNAGGGGGGGAAGGGTTPAGGAVGGSTAGNT